MIVIFDTNQFRQQWWHNQESLVWEQYRNGSAELGFSTSIPDPVIIELVARASENYVKVLSNLRQQVDKLRLDFVPLLQQNQNDILTNVLAISDALPAMFNDQAYESTEQALVSRLSAIVGGFQRIEIPAIQHQDLIRQILRTKRPFKNKDVDKGYRDALIWNCVLAALGEQNDQNQPQTVAFVSENHRDFASEEDNKVLHSDLLEDLTTRQIPHDRLVYLHSLDSFIQQHIDPQFPPLDDVEAALEERDLNLEDLVKDQQAELQQLFREKLRELYDFSPFDGYDTDEPAIDHFEIESCTIAMARQFAPDRLLFRATVECEFGFSFATETFAYWISAEDTVWDGFGSTLNDHYVSIEMGGTCELQISFLLHDDASQIQQLSLNSADLT